MEKEIRYNWEQIAGSPGILVMISKYDLQIDDYQRTLNSNATILSYASSWKWSLCGTLLVADRGGKYFVMDGQQRLAAAKKRSDISVLPCLVFKSQGKVWEAQTFWKFNTNNRKLSSHQLYKAKLLGGDKTTIECDQFVISRGYHISTGKGNKDINCIGTILKYFTNAPATARAAFDLCVAITNGKYRIFGDLFIGATTIVNDGIKLDEVAIDHLQRAGEDGIIREIKNHMIAAGSYGNRPAANALLKIANHKRRPQNRAFLTESH